MVFASYAAEFFCGTVPCTGKVANAIDNVMDTGLLMCWGGLADLACSGGACDPVAINFVPFKICGCCTLFEYPGSAGVPALLKTLENAGAVDKAELAAAVSNQLVELPFATGTAWGLSGEGCITCCEPCGRLPAQREEVRAAVMQKGVVAGAARALAAAMAAGRTLTPALAVLEAYAAFDPTAAAAALPLVRKVLTERLALNAPQLERAETKGKTAVPAGCVACGDGAKALLGHATEQQKAAMGKIVDAVHCAVILATVAAVPNSGLDNALRCEVAKEALMELAGVGARITAADHPAFTKEDNDVHGARMRGIIQRRLENAVEALTAVAEAAGVPAELTADYPKDLALQIPCGPCNLCSSGKAHKVAFLITRWDRKKLSTETVHMRYNLAPPVRLRLKKAGDAGLPRTAAPAPVEGMTMNPLHDKKEAAASSKEEQAPAAAAEEAPAAAAEEVPAPAGDKE